MKHLVRLDALYGAIELSSSVLLGEFEDDAPGCVVVYGFICHSVADAKKRINKRVHSFHIKTYFHKQTSRIN